MKGALAVVFVAGLLGSGALAGAPTGDAEVRALQDELARGMQSLRLPDNPDPYYAEIRLVRARMHTLDGSYGGIITDLA